MDSIETLITYYNNSTEEDIFHNVIEQILENLPKVEGSTIYDLADVCYSSSSTISRLVKKLGFTNYQDFKTKTLYALKNYRYLNRNTRDTEIAEDSDIIDLYFNFLINNLTYLRTEMKYPTISEISDVLNGAQNVLFYSIQDVQIEILQKALLISGKKAIWYDQILSQEGSLSKVNTETVIFAVVPNLLEMSPMRGLIKKAKNLGAKIIILCSGKKNDCLKYGDIQLAFEGTETSMDIYLFRAVINIIKYDYCHRYVDDMVEDLFE